MLLIHFFLYIFSSHPCFLVQDLDFEIASNRMKFSKDGKFLAAVGVYPPQVKVYELEQLSMKFERCVCVCVIESMNAPEREREREREREADCGNDLKLHVSCVRT
jgi:hypothetical protein